MGLLVVLGRRRSLGRVGTGAALLASYELLTVGLLLTASLQRYRMNPVAFRSSRWGSTFIDGFGELKRVSAVGSGVSQNPS